MCIRDRHIKGAEHAGDDINPEAVGQSQAFIKKENGDQPAVYIHGDNPEQGELALEQKTLPADDKGQEGVGGESGESPDNRSGNGNNRAVNEIVFMLSLIHISCHQVQAGAADTDYGPEIYAFFI